MKLHNLAFDDSVDFRLGSSKDSVLTGYFTMGMNSKYMRQWFEYYKIFFYTQRLGHQGCFKVFGQSTPLNQYWPPL